MNATEHKLAHKFYRTNVGHSICSECKLIPFDDDAATPCPGALNDVMEFDHVIRVHEDGTVTDAPSVYAPEFYLEADDDGQISDESEEIARDGLEINGWSLLRGYTGQYSYSGPIMHASEFIGGKLARDILETPGYYVALVANVLTEDPDDDVEPAGWVVAYRESAP